MSHDPRPLRPVRLHDDPLRPRASPTGPARVPHGTSRGNGRCSRAASASGRLGFSKPLASWASWPGVPLSSKFTEMVQLRPEGEIIEPHFRVGKVAHGLHVRKDGFPSIVTAGACEVARVVHDGDPSRHLPSPRHAGSDPAYPASLDDKLKDLPSRSTVVQLALEFRFFIKRVNDK